LLESRKMSALIAYKGYGANYMIEAARNVGAQTIIPPREQEAKYQGTMIKLYINSVT
jgi:hypothetical protein